MKATVILIVILTIFVVFEPQVTSAWVLKRHSEFASRRPTITSRWATALPSDYLSVGNDIIQNAAASCGAQEIQIQWKGDRILVTVKGEVFVSSPLVEGNDEVDIDDVLIKDDNDNDDHDDNDDDKTIKDIQTIAETASPVATAVDLSAVARAINAALEESGDVGLAIAEKHEIEVSTPGASDELSGIMFQSYKGFDVSVQYRDPKAKKNDSNNNLDNILTIEGRLVEKNDQHTVIHINGRRKQFLNENVVSVKLPKAKKEKGVR